MQDWSNIVRPKSLPTVAEVSSPLFSSDLPQPVGARRHARPLQVLVFRGRGCAILEILKLVKILEFLESLDVPYTLHAFRDLRS